MKTIIKTSVLALIAGTCFSAFAAQNSNLVKITGVETRHNGHHAIYISGAVPNEFCTHTDRAILLDGEKGSAFMEKVALNAYLNQKNVYLRVDGCAAINPDQSAYTAPKIVRVYMQ